jgi:hypothetical protein
MFQGGPPLLTSAAVRGVLAVGVSFFVGVIAGEGALATSKIAVAGAALGGAALLLAIFVEMLRGGYGPVLRAELARNTEATDKLCMLVEKLDDDVGKLEAQQALLKSSADAAHKAARKSLSGMSDADASGNFPSLR